MRNGVNLTTSVQLFWPWDHWRPSCGVLRAIRLPRPPTEAAALQPLAVFISGISHWRVPLGRSSIPETWEENWRGWTFPVAYGVRLVGWLQSLRWPYQPVPHGQDHAVSYLELLVNFVIVTGTVPLVEDTANPGKFLSVTDALAHLRHITLRMVVECFRASLKQLGKVLHSAVLPFPEVADVSYMRILQQPRPAPGLFGPTAVARISLGGCAAGIGLGRSSASTAHNL